MFIGNAAFAVRRMLLCNALYIYSYIIHSKFRGITKINIDIEYIIIKLWELETIYVAIVMSIINENY